jgi:hypothetical protein
MWTVAYFIIALAFAVPGLLAGGEWVEPTLMAGSFFATLGIANFFFDRLDKPRKGR